MNETTNQIIILLKELIAIPSFSKEEDQTASCIRKFLEAEGVKVEQKDNNIWARSKYWQADQPVVLLNSHHDTVKPAASWTKDPFTPQVEGDQLFGLGSNDAGGPLVSLIATFCHFYEEQDLPFNLILAATAEEEISGKNGIASILDNLGPIDMAIVGEPTQMQMAIAEKGLIVIDAVAYGISGHAARDEGENAIYKALQDIQWLKDFQFEQTSDLLGPVKISVTQIQAGRQHNVVPDTCSYVIDVRTNEHYSNQAAFELLQRKTQAELKARSFRLNSSGIPLDHPITKAGLSLGMPYYGSPTLSDQALLHCPSLKLGPGDSARSHTADEYIKLREIEEGIQGYIQLLNQLKEQLK